MPKVKAEVKRVQAEMARGKVTTGPGVLRRETGGHVSLQMLARTFGWDYPFAVTYYGGISVIAPGTVNGVYPTIKGKTIKGTDGIYPELEMKEFESSESYVCIELTRKKDASGKQLVLDKMEIVHVKYINDIAPVTWFGGVFGYPNLKGSKTRYPLARIDIQQDGRQVTQIPFYNLQYFVRDNGPVPRHYFVPA